jgi:hypothetical protein
MYVLHAANRHVLQHLTGIPEDIAMEKSAEQQLR